MKTRAGFLSLLAVAVAMLPLRAQPAAPDLVLLGGKVFTGAATRPFAEALAVRGERVVAAGTTSEVEALADRGTRRLDLAGRVVIPGIYDAHFHSLMTPLGGHQLSFDVIDPSWTQTRSAIEAAVHEANAGIWVFGSVGPAVMLAPDVTRDALDQVAPRNPVYLTTFYGHGDLFNTAAMKALGLAERESDPPGGRFERVGDSQRLNGKAWEYAQWRLRRRLARLVPDEVVKKSLRATSEAMLRVGITSVDDMPFMDLGRYVRLRRQVSSPIRLRAIAMPIPGEPDTQSPRAASSGRIRVGGTKWILDGTPFERGVALRGHYRDAPDHSGQMNFTEAEIGSMLDEAVRAHQPLLFHAGGDRTVDAVLRAMEQRPHVNWKQKRVRIEHGDGVTGDLIRRARELGVIVVQNPTHLSLVELVVARYGAETPFFPLRTLLEQGVPIALGSDGPFNPYLNIMFASLDPARPTEAIAREQAVEAYTHGSAYAALVENHRGRLQPGQLADLAVLTQDIFTVPPDRLPATESVLTVIGGQIVYGSMPPVR